MEYRKAQALVLDCKFIRYSHQMREIKVPLLSFYLFFDKVSALELNKEFEYWN